MGCCCTKPDQPVGLVMVGLDSAGKSTVLSHLLPERNISTEPTIGFNFEEVKGSYGSANGIIFKIWDLGGQEKVRPLWAKYTDSTDGIMFVVDSADTDRMAETKGELLKTAKISEKADVPILVLANKQDLSGAKEPTVVKSLVDLKQVGDSGRLTSVCGASAKTGEGLQEALESLYQMIIQKIESSEKVKNKCL